MSLLNSVQNQLAACYMYADNEWLSGFVEFISEDPSNNYSESEIGNLAKEQWLLNDLREICPGCLPADLKSQVKTVLPGKYVLQVNGAVDIGTPAYQLYIKLQKINTENLDATVKYEDKIPSHRMIKLYLTDGVQDIAAIEYKPMRNLSCDLTPGCKILIKGPIECRRGILLLTESCIELLGGEVTEIQVSNSVTGLLSSKLGLPLVQDPDPNTKISNPRNSEMPAPHTLMPPSLEDPGPTFEQTSHPVARELGPSLGQTSRPVSRDFGPIFEPTSRPVARVTSMQVTHNITTDDIDMDEIAALEAQFIENPTKRSSTDEFSKPEKRTKIDPKITKHNEVNRPKNDIVNKVENQNSNVNNPDDYPNENDLLNEDDDLLRELNIENDLIDSKLISTSFEPYMYIKQINDLSASAKAGRVFKVKAKILKLLSKLRIVKDGWSLKCVLVDGTGSIDVEFTSKILSDIVGYTPQEMNQLKKEISKPEVKQEITLALTKARDYLQVLHCIFELTIMNTVKITALSPSEESHANLLDK